MKQQLHPHLIRSNHSLDEWLISLADGTDPTELRVRNINRYCSGAEFSLQYAFPVDGYRAGLVYAGTEPEYVRPDGEATAWFKLKASCVVFLWELNYDLVFSSRAMIVEPKARRKRGEHSSSIVSLGVRIAQLSLDQQRQLADPKR